MVWEGNKEQRGKSAANGKERRKNQTRSSERESHKWSGEVVTHVGPLLLKESKRAATLPIKKEDLTKTVKEKRKRHWIKSILDPSLEQQENSFYMRTPGEDFSSREGPSKKKRQSENRRNGMKKSQVFLSTSENKIGGFIDPLNRLESGLESRGGYHKQKKKNSAGIPHELEILPRIDAIGKTRPGTHNKQVRSCQLIGSNKKQQSRWYGPEAEECGQKVSL